MRHLKDWDVSLDGIIAEKKKYWTFYNIYLNIDVYIQFELMRPNFLIIWKCHFTFCILQNFIVFNTNKSYTSSSPKDTAIDIVYYVSLRDLFDDLEADFSFYAECIIEIPNMTGYSQL